MRSPHRGHMSDIARYMRRIFRIGMASASTWPSLVKIDHVISKSVNEIFPKKDRVVDFKAP